MNYEQERANFQLEIPENYNFAFDLVDQRARETPDRTALICVDQSVESIERHSYGRLAADSARFGNALRDLGANKGDFAFVMIPRIAAWYQVLLGTMKVGVVSMPGTNLLTAKDIEYRVNRAGARFLIVTEEHAEKVEQVRDKCPTLETCIIVGAPRDGWVHYESACRNASPALSRDDVLADAKATDMMLIYFTSGTTSLPKMVARDHSYALAHTITGKYWMDLKPGDIHWTLTDTGWAKAAWGLLFPPMLLGAEVIVYDGAGAFDPHAHLKVIEKLKVTTFCAPPTVYRVFAQTDLSGYDLSSLRHCFGAGEPLNPEAMRSWKAATGCDIYDGYGQTETVNIVANFPGMEIRPGSMGKPVPGLDVDIVDDDGNILDTDEIGHIAIRITDPWPPGLFDGYLKQKDPKASFSNGWYYTGDTATRDKDGYIWFVGRTDDIITSAGYRISPFEVESALIEHPAIVESAVVGKPDPMRGEIVKAFVVLAQDYEPSDELAKDIQEFVKNLTAPYKYPREITFREALPKTVSGKLRRVELREEA